MLDNVEYAVTDVETTGLFPKHHDRIVEIAIVRIDGRGSVLDEYATLINPLRDIGATHIHGITASEVKDAPEFQEVAGDLLDRLRGAVFVAHNVHFDKRFIEAEFLRIGVALPEFPYLCTMQLSRRADTASPGRKLQVLCDYFGVPVKQLHSALSDARATAGLLTTCFERLRSRQASDLVDLGVKGGFCKAAAWPDIPFTRDSYPREAGAKDAANLVPFIERLVAKLPTSAEPSGNNEEYMALLDRVLEDRRVTSDEAVSLLALATELGLSRDAAIEAHKLYMRDLMRAALEDSVITDSEQRDLEEVRKLLDVTSDDFKWMVEEIRKDRLTGQLDTATAIPSVDWVGKRICFTGSFRCHVDGQRMSRTEAKRLASTHGMVVVDTCTKKLDYLVTADPDSMSGKARKARKFGVRILAEPVFLRMMGVNFD